MTEPVDAMAAPGADGALQVEEALRRLLAASCPVAGTEALALEAAHGRVLAAAVQAPISLPPCDNAAMDGYALRHADLRSGETTSLSVAGRALAGVPYEGTCPAAGAVRIMTGAALPEGLDTVVPQELVAARDATILVPPGQRRGQHCRLAGEDIVAGAAALPAGCRLNAADIGLVAALGLETVLVRRRPRVAMFSTGSELRPVGNRLGHGQIHDSNRHVLRALLASLGVVAIDLGVVADRPECLEAAMRDAAADADAVISTGGVSVGEADHVRTILARIGELDFWQVAMRPGRPFTAGRIGSARYFGLPGNPVAAIVTFLILVRPALLALAGARPRLPATIQARAIDPIPKRAGRAEYPRGILHAGTDGGHGVALAEGQGSGMLTSLTRADCLVVLPHDRGAVAPGEAVECLPFAGLL